MIDVLIDTDILSFFLKGNKKVYLNFQKHLQNHSQLNISIITQYEILSGLAYNDANKQAEIFEDFCKGNNVINLNRASIFASAEIYASLRKNGKTVGDIDLLIAGIAISNNYTLVTNNTKHFENIEGLRIVNWNK